MFVQIRNISVAAVMLAAAQAQAQPQPAPPLSLDAAVRAAVARHPDLAAVEAAVAAARLRPAAERELMPPMLELQTFEWPRNRGNPQAAQWMLTLSQQLPARGKRDLRAARARAEADVMASEAGIRQREVAADVARTYIDLRLAREELALLDTARTVTADSIDAAEARYASAMGSQQDVLAGIVELARLQEQRAMARERARQAEARLNLLLGRDVEAPIGNLEATPDEVAVPRLADLDAQLLAAHPETIAIERRRALAEADLALARRESAPDFIVQGGYMLMPSMPDAFTASVSLTWPSAPWMKQRTARLTQVADAGLAAVDAERAAVALRLRTMAQEAIVAAAGAAERAEILSATLVPRVEHALDVARAAYEASRGDLTAVVEARRRLVDARLDIRRALADRDRALVALRALLGEFDAARP